MLWLIGGIVFLLTAGLAKISTIILNRLLAIPQPKWLIGLTEVAQILLISLYAWTMFYRLVRIDHWSLAGDHGWEAVASLDIFLIAMGILGLAALIRSTIAYQRYCPPDCQIAADSRVIDFRQSREFYPWNDTLVGPRPMRRIALLPGNEQFTVEVSTKTFALPRLPDGCDGLSIVQLADTHFLGAVSPKYFQAVCEQAIALKPDLFVFTGDLLDDLSTLDWLPETLGRLKAPLGQYFVLGNHDWYVNAPAIRKEFERHGWIDMSGRTRELTSPRVRAADRPRWR